MNPGFTGSPLDRSDHVRTDPAAIERALADPRARVLDLRGLDPQLDPEGRLRWRAPRSAAEAMLFLGFDGEVPCFAELEDDPPAGTGSIAIVPLLHRLPAAEAALYGGARSLVDWHYRHGFCARCGAATAPFRAGWGRRCASCRAEHFPRVDPVVIMLAEHEGRVLLGRQPQFPPRMYSALAGFVEPGESLEEAVCRELREEAGISAHSVRYVLSQPWPFPSSLMVGCIAQAASDAVVLDSTELQHAIWVERHEVEAVLAGSREERFSAPPPLAIAHSLLAAWLAQ